MDVSRVLCPHKCFKRKNCMTGLHVLLVSTVFEFSAVKQKFPLNVVIVAGALWWDGPNRIQTVTHLKKKVHYSTKKVRQILSVAVYMSKCLSMCVFVSMRIVTTISQKNIYLCMQKCTASQLYLLITVCLEWDVISLWLFLDENSDNCGKNNVTKHEGEAIKWKDTFRRD